MEYPIIISNLNDYIFCPASIYFHNLYGEQDRMTYQSHYQINGTKAHESVDNGTYSTRKNVIAALPVYSEKYGLYGKIDIYDGNNKILIERKKHINQIYDGYIYQIYGQYYAMTEMGYEIDKLEIRSIDNNKTYKIDLPCENVEMKDRFEELIKSINSFDLEKFQQNNIEKCKKCIYEDACDRALNREG